MEKNVPDIFIIFFLIQYIWECKIQIYIKQL